MLAGGTNVYGPLFVGAALVVLALIGWLAYGFWRQYFTRMNEANKKGTTHPSIVNPIILTLLIGTISVVLLTLGWNAIQDVTTNSSGYTNPAEIQEQKKVNETQLPTKEEMDQTRTDLKQRAEVKPHEKAIDSFNEKMRHEAEVIRQRNASQPATQPVEK